MLFNCATAMCHNLVAPKASPGGHPKRFCSRQCASRGRSRQRAILVTCRRANCANIFHKHTQKLTCSKECAKEMQRRPWALVTCSFAPCSNLLSTSRGKRLCSKSCAQTAYVIAKKYNLDVDDYAALLRDQAGSCAICGTPETTSRSGVPQRLSVDHDHATGKVRGLLCHPCNAGLGLFRDDPAALAAAITYLQR